MKFYEESLLLTHPAIAAEWSEKNLSITPKDVTAGSHDRVWWKGKCGHEWQATVGNRCLNGTGCPYCSNRSVLKGFNDLATLHPELLPEWSERNGDLKPEEIRPFARKKVWWKCKNGHEWKASVHDRSRGNGCAVCSNKVLLKGFNDLLSKRPDIAKEWSDKNLPLTPDEVKWKSDTQRWWKCSTCGNEYKDKVYRRVIEGKGCPYCSGLKILSGFNDLTTTDPDIAKDWDYDSNGALLPETFYRTSMLFVNWNCSNGHTYGMKISDRTLKGKGCIICDVRFQASFSLLLVLLFAKREGIRYEIGNNTSGLYLPDFKVAFEAECVSLQKQKEQQEKIKRLKKDGIKLVVFSRASDLKEASRTVRSIFSKNSVKITSEIDEDIEILKKEFYGKDYRVGPYEGGGIFKDVRGFIRNEERIPTKMLPETNPELCPEWSEKNFPFMPEDEHLKSCSKVWWKCSKCGCEWKSMVENRTRLKKGCPVCAGKIVVVGINDMRSLYPEVAKEWSEKNADLKPDQVTAGSCRKVWWRCEKGHEWQTTVASRCNGGNGCPVCARDPVIKGVNDLLVTNPEVLKIWSDKNGDLTPQDIRRSYHKPVWWKCDVCGNEYRAQPRTVITRKRPGCPKCSTRIGIGWKDLIKENEFIKEEFK